MDEGLLALHGWRFDMETGCIQEYHSKSNQFQNLSLAFSSDQRNKQHHYKNR